MILAPTIYVEADVDSFTFRRGSKSVAIEPFLYVATTEPKIILLIGDHYSDQRGSMFIHLFKRPLLPISYSDILASFMRHGVSTVAHGPFLMIRPQFRIRVSQKIVDFTGGYHDGVFRAAALDAGARRSDHVVIEDPAEP